MIASTLSPDVRESILSPLRESNELFAARYPGDPYERQPVHVVYGGAQLFSRTTAARMGELALRALNTWAATPEDLTRVLDVPGALAQRVHERVTAKLQREAVEDFRIDFEDGYGNRPDEEEDGDAARCAVEVAAGMRESSLPPFIGIRIKPLSNEMVQRSLRTLDVFVTALARETGGALPDGFVITLPKVTHVEQVQAAVAVLDRLEQELGIAAGALRLELMVETPQSIIGADGRAALPELVAAGDGRVRGAHFGTYDYTALVGVTAAQQYMAHPACDFAKHVMQVSLAGRGVIISDGATNVMPVGPHRAADGVDLSDAQVQENREVVERAWRLAWFHNMHSLRQGFYQGWDLHPAQLPVRYAATYTFFLEGLDDAAARLRSFLDKAAQATLLGDVFDDAATGQGLLNVFLRGLSCGAISEEEALASGCTLDEMRTRSFLAILDGRRQAPSAAGSPT